ncbi:hypothetical protein MTR_5g024110 [Medicago truncatula]|uniref:Uncharacterized protein n=1 Tax=Medicago truncatula TaxID=3880 RepID=G7K173_MEDTR|nr:hypothetical protein MTR_5g024110 [Medicago truncatula]
MKVFNKSYTHHPSIKVTVLQTHGVSPFNGFTYDHIFGTNVDGTIFDRFSHRHTAAELLASETPTNILYLIHATVQKIVSHLTEHFLDGPFVSLQHNIICLLNFGGLSPYTACSGFKWAPRKWTVGLVPSD